MGGGVWWPIVFENWCNGELSKIGHNFSNNKKQLSKNVNNKICAPKLLSSMTKKGEIFL